MEIFIPEDSSLEASVTRILPDHTFAVSASSDDLHGPRQQVTPSSAYRFIYRRGIGLHHFSNALNVNEPILLTSENHWFNCDLFSVFNIWKKLRDNCFAIISCGSFWCIDSMKRDAKFSLPPVIRQGINPRLTRDAEGSRPEEIAGVLDSLRHLATTSLAAVSLPAKSASTISLHSCRVLWLPFIRTALKKPVLQGEYLKRSFPTNQVFATALCVAGWSRSSFPRRYLQNTQCPQNAFVVMALGAIWPITAKLSAGIAFSTVDQIRYCGLWWVVGQN